MVKLGEGTLSLARPQPHNNAITDTTANVNTTIIRITIIITLPTTVTTTTYFPTSLHYLHKSLYELVLYLEQNHIKHYDLYYD